MTAENVLVVVLDTVRASETCLAGQETTPTLRDTASRGATFERAIAPAAWTLPSHASMYTGKSPREHGAVSTHRYLTTGHEKLAERLSNAGFRTGVFTPNLFLSETFGGPVASTNDSS